MNDIVKRPTLALAMIVKNEEENLPRLFKSIEGCFDEIHITDTGSTDKTVALCKEWGCHVKTIPWPNDFSKARNVSFEGITTDYIMWMDADDILDNSNDFIHWRDHVMNLGDYWVATYHYSHDEKKNPVCSFVRERVIKNHRGFKWKYFVHEGIVPESPFGGVRPQYTAAWNVRHQRTQADLDKDKLRNLNIFELNLHEMDARMRYYYGKELFEAQKAEQSIPHLMQAATDSKLEMHDRILAIQYCCYALINVGNSLQEKGSLDQANQKFMACMDLAHQGLMLSPHRAEFHTMIGDAYLKLGQIHNAIPFFHAAKACEYNSGEPSAIFKHEMAYTTYPRNQIARIQANLGRFDMAKLEVTDALSKFDNEESRLILTEVERIQGLTTAYKTAKDCGDIVISCPPQGAYLWDADLAKTKAMGGSETAAIEMAYWLHKKSGRKVIVFNPREDVKVIDGVEYRPANTINDYFGAHKPFLHIAWRHNIKLTDAPTFVWCHDLITQGAENHSNYLKIFALTPFHAEYLYSSQGVPKNKIWVTRNGLKPERFSDGPWKKDPNKFIFSSSPDRGLDRTMRVLDRVREEFPDIKLHIYYGIEHLDKYGLGDLRKNLQAMMDERKDWVIYHGATQQDKLMREFKEAAYCVQPSDWIETSMISAMERACCGIFQIIRAVGGVVDTLSRQHREGMAILVDSDCITESQHDLYAEEVKKALREEAYKRVCVNAEELSWERISHSWLKMLPLFADTAKVVLEEKTG